MFTLDDVLYINWIIQKVQAIIVAYVTIRIETNKYRLNKYGQILLSVRNNERSRSAV